MRGQESGSHADLNAVSGLVKPSSVLFSLLNHHYIFPSILSFFYPLTTPTPALGLLSRLVRVPTIWSPCVLPTPFHNVTHPSPGLFH